MYTVIFKSALIVSLLVHKDFQQLTLASTHPQAADEFVVQARNTERRWSRALQHEHSLRLKLQENIEALAKQMTNMEDEARLKFQGTRPLITSSPEASESSGSTSGSSSRTGL